MSGGHLLSSKNSTSQSKHWKHSFILILPLGSIAWTGHDFSQRWQGLPHSGLLGIIFNIWKRPRKARTAPSGHINLQKNRSEKIAIANKESIICAWNILSKELKKNKTKFIPVDSEHFSIWSVLKNIHNKNIGDSINVETDIIGKYIVRFISESDSYEDINSMLIKTINKLGLS